MKREINRKKNLPAFLIGIGELELLLGRLRDLFENPEKIYVSINVTLPLEKLNFNSLEEMKSYTPLRGRITDFSLYLSQNGRNISVRSGSKGFLGGPATISVDGENEAWCAGAIETIYSFLQMHKVWYHWFVSVPIGWILYSIIVFLPLIVSLFLPKGAIIDKTIIAAWLLTTVSLAFLYFAKGWLLPSAVLRITEEQNFIRRYAAELSLFIALISVILTIIGWFVGKQA